MVRAALDDAGIAPHQLTLEITEGLLVEDGDRIQLQLRELKGIGVRLAVDDFGTGYSALSYLRSFPLDLLKIDRSFVAGIDHDPDRARLVRDIVEMAHNLGLSVMTEGIEEAGEAALVRELRSDYGQGYWFSRPAGPGTIDACSPAGSGSTRCARRDEAPDVRRPASRRRRVADPREHVLPSPAPSSAASPSPPPCACLLGLASARAQPAAAGTQPIDLRVSVRLAPGSGSAL